MAQYKVIQDIEAEDKLLGPLSLRQFIYAIIVIVLGFIAFKLITVQWYFAIPFLPPMLFFGLLAAPFGQNQSSEVWMLAKIRFFVFPKTRIWNQSGIEELVHITVPKKIEKYVSKGFSQDEVRSRLSALANTLDTRGWAIKNVSTDVFQKATAYGAQAQTDRLIDINSIPQTNTVQELPGDDLFDAQSSPLARMTSQNIQASDEMHRQQLMNNLQDQIAATQPTQTPPASVQPVTSVPAPAQPVATVPDLPVPAVSVPATSTPVTVVAPHHEADENIEQPHGPQQILGSHGQQLHHETNEAIATQSAQASEKNLDAAMTTSDQTAKINGVTDTDRNTMRVARTDDDTSDDEVVISLH